MKGWSAQLTLDPAVRRILIIKWSAMGDVVIATAACQDIADAFPRAQIDLNILPPWDVLFRDDPRFRRVLTVDLRKTERGPRGMLRWLREVRGGRYDAIVDLQSTDHTRVLLSLLWMSGAAPRYRIGYHRRFPYNVAPSPRAPEAHAHDYARAALEAAGVPTRAQRPVLSLSTLDRQRVQGLLAHHDLEADGYAVFLPGSQAAGHLKRWGAERYAALARRVHDSGVPKVVLIGGPEEVDECERIAASCGDWLVNLCERTDLRDVVPICEGARFVVGNDTGTAHLASVTSRPITVICGPTDPRRVRPLGNNVQVLQADLPCINCYFKTCSHHSCMKQITPERVAQTLPLP